MTILTNSSPFLQSLDYSNMSNDEKALIDALIEVANDYLEKKEFNRIFSAADYIDEQSNGSGWNFFFVKNPPINSLTNVKVVTYYSDSEDTTIYTSSALVYEASTGMIQFRNTNCIWPPGFQNIRVTYNGGFTTIPRAIEQIAANFVLQNYDPRLVVESLQKERIGDYFYDLGVHYFDRLPTSLKRMMSRYKLRPITTYRET